MVNLFAIIVPVDLEVRIQHAKQIVLGEVVEQTAHWDKTKHNIYTTHRLRITAYLKGEQREQYINFITLGGVVEDEAQSVFPNIHLELGAEYCLFMKDAPLEIVQPGIAQSRTATGVHFQAFAHVQGVLPMSAHQYMDEFSQTTWTEHKLVDRIAEVTNFRPIEPNGQLFRARTAEQVIAARNKRSNSIQLSNGAGQVTANFHAGTIDEVEEMIITGGDFGNEIGSIEFTNANTGGLNMGVLTYETDILYWTDQEIRLKVPHFAGTGIVNIRNKAGILVGTVNITIEWSLQSIYSDYRNFEADTRQIPKLLDVNKEGGYTILVNTTTGFATDQEAVSAFERALNTWQCTTTVNWELDKSGTPVGVVKDDLCVVQYSTDLPYGVLGLATTRYKALGSSRCNQENTLWSVREFDVEFVPTSHLIPGFSWNFSEETPSAFQFDFESIALHELGHAHGLAHVIDEDNIMHFSISNGQVRRTPAAHAAEAGNHKVSLSMTDHCITSGESMTPYPVDCSAALGTPAVPITARIKIILEGFYNVATTEMNNFIVVANLLPSIQPFNRAPYNYTGTEVLGTTSTDIVDWVLVQLRAVDDFKQVVHQKAALLRKDGLIVNEDGQELIDFKLPTGGAYLIAIHHKSHLPVMSNVSQVFSRTPGLYDFTLSEVTAMGDAQLKEVDNKFVLNAGDFDGNGIINNQDFNIWKVSSATLNQYLPADPDGNGIINNQDYNFWKSNVSKVSILLE